MERVLTWLKDKKRQLRAHWWVLRHHQDALNRRVKVERYLFKVVEGKKPLPDVKKCRQLAIDLGVPSEYRQKEL